MFCSNCGKELADNAIMCPNCGAPTKNTRPQKEFDPNASSCDWVVTLILCIFLGYLGIHSFYTKKTGIGIIQLLTGGGCGIWVLIDLIMLVMGTFKDGDGKIFKNQ